MKQQQQQPKIKQIIANNKLSVAFGELLIEITELETCLVVCS